MALTKYQETTLRRAAKIMEDLVRTSDILSSPKHVREYLKYSIGALEHEVFAVIYLDNRHKVIEVNPCLFRGTIDHASIPPREVVKEALKHNASAVLFAHNHPSFVAEPSDADVRITRRLQEALDLVGCRVLDHLIIAGPNCTSLAERGLL